MTMGSAEFADLVKQMLADLDRGLRVTYESGLGGKLVDGVYRPRTDDVTVTYINLPLTIVTKAEGGGAEVENNRMTFWIHGFDRFDPHAPPPTGRVKIEQSVSALPRAFNLRAKTASPDRIAEYLTEHLRDISHSVPPNLTHSRADR